MQSKCCYVCQKGVTFGNNVSHANTRTRRVWKPNLQVARILVDGKITKIKVVPPAILNREPAFGSLFFCPAADPRGAV